MKGVLDEYRKSGEGKKVVAAKVEAKFKAEISDLSAHNTEGTALKEFKDSAVGLKLLAKKVKLEAEKKEEHALLEEQDTKASEIFEASAGGKHIRKQLLRSEQAKIASDNAIKRMRGEDLSHAFQAASDEMAEIIKGGKAGLKERLDLAADGDKERGIEGNDYIKSLRSSTLLKEDERAEHLSQTRAEEKAKAGWYEIPKLGRASPSTAMDQMIDETGKKLKSMEAQDGGAYAATQIAHILRLKQNADKQRADNKIAKKAGKPEKPVVEISDEQQAALFSSVAHITKEAWTDDTIAEISAMFKDLHAGKITDSEEAADVEAMEKIFVDQLDLIKRHESTNEKGEKVLSYSSVSNQENAAALQNLVVTGGNLEMVKANQNIDAAIMHLKSQKDDYRTAEGLTNKSNYEVFNTC